MPGPNGEQCSLCYYYEQTATPNGYCHFENPDLYPAGSRTIKGYWPSTYDTGWCGNFLDKATATGGFSATGAFVTPLGTNFSITDTVNWIKYDPGNLLDGAIMINMTLANGTLTWSIPGTFPGGTQWESVLSMWGSVTFPTANTSVAFSPGTAGVPYSANVAQALQVNPQMTGVALPFSLQGIAPTSQSGSAELLVRGDIGTATFNSCAFQVRIRRLS